MSLISELQRRNVLRVGAAYIVTSWLLIQVAETIFPLFGFSDAPARVVVVVLAIGFIPALVVAWAFELTPEGLIRDKDVDRSVAVPSAKRLDRIFMVVLTLALGYFALDKFVLSEMREAALVEQARQQGRTDALLGLHRDKSIVVLPFVNMSDDSGNEYFSDGVSEELLNLLAQIADLRVISRTSAFSFKDKDVKVAQVAEELNVSHVLEGSVRKSGDRVRITAQLIDAKSDTHLWSDTYDRTLTDVFAVQDEIAAAVVEQLRLRLLDKAPRTIPVDPEAYALFLQAQQLRNQQTFESMSKAIELYQESLAIDSGYPASWGGLASIYIKQGRDDVLPREEAYRLASEAVANALEIAPDYAPTYARLAKLAIHYDSDLPAAARYLNEALAMEPNNAEIIDIVGLLAVFLGHRDEAIAFAEFQARRDPVNPMAHSHLGATYFTGGHFDKAVDSYRTALALSPDYIGAHYELGLALLGKNDASAALEAMQKEPDEEYRVKGTALALYEMGRHDEFETTFQELRDRWGGRWPTEIAEVYAWIGDADAAFEWLQKEYENLGKRAVPEIVAERLYENIHDDPRWVPFLEKLGKAPEQLQSIELDLDSLDLKDVAGPVTTH